MIEKVTLFLILFVSPLAIIIFHLSFLEKLLRKSDERRFSILSVIVTLYCILLFVLNKKSDYSWMAFLPSIYMFSAIFLKFLLFDYLLRNRVGNNAVDEPVLSMPGMLWFYSDKNKREPYFEESIYSFIMFILPWILIILF